LNGFWLIVGKFWKLDHRRNSAGTDFSRCNRPLFLGVPGSAHTHAIRNCIESPGQPEQWPISRAYGISGLEIRHWIAASGELGRWIRPILRALDNCRCGSFPGPVYEPTGSTGVRVGAIRTDINARTVRIDGREVTPVSDGFIRRLFGDFC